MAEAMTIEKADPALADEPFGAFAAWFADAAGAEPRDANAMMLATVDDKGAPNLRTVLLKDFDSSGFVFYTNFTSAKGRELLAHPVAALNFHWKSLGRQVRIRGPVETVPDEEADAYFATRPRLSQIGAWASAQSSVIESRQVLEAAVAEIERRFADGAVPRPPYWSGFRVKPIEIEFWHDAPYRLHDRFLFRRPSPETASWTKQRLSP